MTRFTTSCFLFLLGALLADGRPLSAALPPKLEHVEPAAIGIDPDALQAVDELVAEGLREGKMPGAVILAAWRGRIFYLKAFGDRRVEPDKQPMETSTVFDMASITKPVATATSVMALIQDGEIRLDEPVATYIPEFGQNRKEGLTVRDLLLHQSGLIPDNSLSDYDGSPSESLAKICALELSHPPRTRFLYSDVNFIVLGELVKRVSGQSVHEFSQSRIFAPLGMNETGYLPAAALRDRAAPTEQRDGAWIQGEVHDPRAYRLGGVAGHAGLFSTATDLAVYAQMMLGRGEYQGVRILEPATVDLMTFPNIVPGGGRRGLGWDIQTGFSSNRGDAMSRRAFGHGGFTGTVLWIDPELDLTFIFLSNRVHPNGKGAVNPLAGSIANVFATAIREAASHDGVPPQVLTGIDVLQRDEFSHLAGKKIGLITNQTGVNRDWKDTISILHDAKNVELKAIFSPEHGIRGALDQSQIADSRDEQTGLPIYSLYGESRAPSDESLQGLDALVFDIQDIGARFYTYPSTMAAAMQAAAKHKLTFVVLDRPNPINGADIEGPLLDDGSQSFVGFHTLPVRHGMTIGELARMFQIETKLDVDLRIVRMKGWNRSEEFDQTGLPWVNPSPNMRSLTEAILYPGMGLLELTNVSVGRGTDRPFEIFGAPWIDGQKLAEELRTAKLEGVSFIPIRFTPTSSKFASQECGGIDLMVTNRETIQPVRLGLTIAAALRKLYPKEWETKSFNRLLSNQTTFDAILNGKSANDIAEELPAPLEEFRERREKFLLY